MNPSGTPQCARHSEIAPDGVRRRRPAAAARVAATLALAAAAGLSSHAGAQTPVPGAMWLRIVDADQEPLAGAEVVLPMLGVSLKVPDGGALLITGVPAGTYLVQARQLGFAPAWRTLRVGRDTIAAQLALAPIGQLLDTMSVTAKLTPVEARLIDFERRRSRRSFGQFITRDDIERRRPVDVASMLRTVPGVEVKTGVGVTSVSSRRVVGHSTCTGMLIFLDGVLVVGRQPINGGVRLPSTSAGLGAGERGAGGYRPTTVGSSSTNGEPTPGGTRPGGTSGSGPGTAPMPASGSGTTGGPGTGIPSAQVPTPGSTGRLFAAEPNWAAVAAPTAGATPAFDVNTIPTSLLAGVEVYTGIAGIPPEYAGYVGAECGVVLMWTGAR